MTDDNVADRQQMEIETDVRQYLANSNDPWPDHDQGQYAGR
jgi:hypothetical protein